MFDLIFRNITSRKIRSALTICGIALGIFAVIVMGAMSENFHQTFERSMGVTSDKIRIFAESGVFGGGLSNNKVSDVLRVAGVKDAYGLLMTTFDEDKMGMTGKQILGVPPEKSAIALSPVELKAGRFLHPGDSYQVVVGNNIKREYELELGSRFEIHEKYFNVVGILDYTGSIFDNAVIIPLETAQELYNVGDSLSYIFAVPAEGLDAERLSKRIELSVKGTSTLSPGELQTQARQSFMIFSVITISSGLLAAIIGGLCVMNTMLMSVSERTREFGILKAMGAETKDILLLTLGEACLMGLLGGVLGLFVGIGAVAIMNAWLAKTRIVLFLITPRLLLIALLFSLFIGALSGLYPAYRASKMSPMEALKHA
ncbi:MAG: ABC transporter permease [Methanosarcinaceae archaeon]|nr:ABC transporter permease [Methanosarcinaceae archaeon]MDD4331747.1 ABC transporter permease [Methanosarcinaceae archaeon]MDD4749153.1 ABC transporter permease [Methanosarcinaceae archaeon]